MKDMQHSGNEALAFSQALNILIKHVDYYLKSGYFLTDSSEIDLIKSLFTNIHNQILALKTHPRSSQHQRNLYNDFCKVRLMLSSSVFKSACPNHKMHGQSRVKCDNFYMQQIMSSYAKCISALENELTQVGAKTAHSYDLFRVRSVLLGPLRNREQLSICLKGNFYHIPADKLEADVGDVSHIAIYQSKNFYGKDAGIRFWGNVISCEKIKRSELTEIPKKSDELYYLFKVDSWKRLKNDIVMSGGGVPFSLTSLHLLLNSRDVCELNFRDPITHKLFCQIRFLAESGRNNVACHYRAGTFAIENETVSLYKNKKCVCCVSIRDYLSNPGKYFWHMLRLVNDK